MKHTQWHFAAQTRLRITAVCTEKRESKRQTNKQKETHYFKTFQMFENIRMVFKYMFPSGNLNFELFFLICIHIPVTKNLLPLF